MRDTIRFKTYARGQRLLALTLCVLLLAASPSTAAAPPFVVRARGGEVLPTAQALSMPGDTGAQDGAQVGGGEQPSDDPVAPETPVAPNAPTGQDASSAPDAPVIPGNSGTPEAPTAPGTGTQPENAAPPSEGDGQAQPEEQNDEQTGEESAPAEEDATGEATVPPANAAQDAAFAQGYAMLLGSAQARRHAHTREAAYPVLSLAQGEIVWVASRAAYAATQKEKASGEAYADWFLVQAYDAEGTWVQGWVSGESLRPLTPEETDGLLSGWPEDTWPALREEIPCVAGLALPPPSPTEPGAQGEQNPPATDEAQDAEGDDAPKEDAPSEEGAADDSDASALPGGANEDDAPETLPAQDADGDTDHDEEGGADADAGDGENAPYTDEQLAAQLAAEEAAALEQALAEQLALATQLIAEGEDFFENADALARALAMQRDMPMPDDVCAPVIGSIGIVYALEPPVTSAQLIIPVEDLPDPDDPDALVSGVREVAVQNPSGQTKVCSYVDALRAYVLTVYADGLYDVWATDAAGNTAQAQVQVQNLMQGQAGADVTPPELGEPLLTPPQEWAEEVALAIAATDASASPREPASGVGDVWLYAPDGTRTLCGYDVEAGQYTNILYVNGTYQVIAFDMAGNDAEQVFTVSYILDMDTYPPTIGGVSVDPPFDDKKPMLSPMVELTIYAADDPRPNSHERASGMQDVFIARYYGEDPDTQEPLLDTPEYCFPMDEGVYAYYFEENGEYMVLAVDMAGNVAMKRVDMGHVGNEKPRRRDPEWASILRPVDEDGDGLYTQTEYRLGLDPMQRDTRGDGLWDGLSLRLGLDGLHAPRTVSVLAQAQDTAPLDALVAGGQLLDPVTEHAPRNARRQTQEQWDKLRTTVVWMDPLGNAMLCVNNRTLFMASIPRSERVQVEGTLSLELLAMGSVNNDIARTVDVTPDGSMALLYDREGDGGTLRQDAYLVDTARMQAYRIPDTRGARGVALSDDGTYLAIWYENALVRIHTQTGDIWRCDDANRCGRIEMLAFLSDNSLVTRVTTIGYNALLPDGTRQVGDPRALPCLTQRQSLESMTLYDRSMSAIDVPIQLLLRATGLYLSGEPEKEKPIRNLSPRTVFEMGDGTASK